MPKTIFNEITFPTNVTDIETNQRLTIGDFASEKTVLVEQETVPRYGVIDFWMLFRDNLFYRYDYEFESQQDADNVTPMDFSTAWIYLNGYFAYAFFDPNGSAQWEHTAYEFTSDQDYENWLLDSWGLLFAQYSYPRGVLIRIELNTGNKFGFFNSSKGLFTYPTENFIANEMLHIKYYIDHIYIGYRNVFSGSNINVNTYLKESPYIVLDKQFLKKAIRNNFYAVYGDSPYVGFYDNKYFYVKQKIHSVDAEYKNTWLKCYFPENPAQYQFKNGHGELSTGIGKMVVPIIVNSVDKEAPEDSIEPNIVLVRDHHIKISPIYDVTDYIIEYEAFFETNDEGITLINNTSTYPVIGDNILISDIVDSHSAWMAEWVLAYHPSFNGDVIQTNNEPTGDFIVNSQLGSTYAKLYGCDMIVEATGVGATKGSIADPDLIMIVGHGANDPIEINRTNAPEQFYDNIIMVGAGDPNDPDEAWQTSYGNGVEFIEPTIQGMVPGVFNLWPEHKQSPATAFVAGKLHEIKQQTGVHWGIVRRAARETASNSQNWDMYRGYGIIDVQAAIQWINDNYPTLNDFMNYR